MNASSEPARGSVSAPAAPFRFVDAGPLIDDELELVAPSDRWIDDILAACNHPLTIQTEPTEGSITRRRLLEFLSGAPGGHQPPDPSRGLVPAYHFWMHPRKAMTSPVIQIAGGLNLRVGITPEIEMYSGNIGYHVYPPFRGHHFAERACRLVLPLARHHGMTALWITCNPDNVASRRTCERLGARLVEIVTIPRGHPFRARGETEKCRYLLELG